MHPRLTRAAAAFSAAMFVFSMLATAPVAVASNGVNGDDPDKPPIGHDISDRKYLNLREKQIALYRGFPFRLPYNGRKVAITQMLHQQQQAQHGSPGPNTVPAWASIGPDPIPNGQVAGGATSVSVSGRVTAIVVDPNSANVVYVGTAQGGVYRSSDANLATPTWTPLMDNADSLAVGALALDPSDPTILWVGTGEGNFSLDSFAGVGLYKITGANSGSGTLHGPFDTKVDGTGTLAAGGSAFNGESITSISIDPNDHTKMFVGTSLGFSGASGDVHFTRAPIGLYWSGNAANATPTFSRVGGIPGGQSTISDVLFAPTSSALLYVGVGDLAGTNSGLYKSTNANAATTGSSGVSPTFSRVVDTSLNLFNIKLAANKVSTTTTVLAAIENLSGGRLIKTTDAFATAPTTLTDAAGYCGGQCYYDIAIAIDPANANNIYLGGSADGGAATQFERSTDGGTTFNVTDTNLHPDTHAIAVAKSNTAILYHGNDGGIFRSADSGATWTSINTAGFLATQFESIAVHPTNANFTIGGTQDNGTEFRNGAGSWTRADFGDGGFSAIDQNAADTTTVTMYHTYFNQKNNLLGFGRVTATSQAHDNGWTFFGCGGVNPNGINCSDDTLFYAPIALGPGTPNTLYFGSDRLYRSGDSGVTATHVGANAAIEAGIPISAIGIAPLDDKVRIVGLTNGHVYRTTTAAPGTLTAVTGGWPAGKYIARAVIDPTASGTAYVTLDGYAGGTTSALSHVWKTTNLGAATPTWVSKGAGIPDVPVNSFVIDPNDHLHLFAGTDIGVYESVDGGTNWTPFGTGLPIVAIFDMAIAQPGTGSEVLRVATHGKGMWETAIAAGSSFTLTAHLAGSGSGNVTSTDANINCPGTCFHDYGVLTNGIVIQQTPGGGSTFGGWSGCDSVVGTDCHINVNGAENVTATFNSSDSTAPTASMNQPSLAYNAAKPIAIAWSGNDTGGSGLKNFDVRVHKAKYNTQTFGTFTNIAGLQATTSTSSTFTGTPGFTYCFSVRARDNALNVGSYSAQKCTMVPVDDKAFTHSTGWTQLTGQAGDYLGTISKSSTHGKTMTLGSVHAKQLAVLAIGCPGCGAITFNFANKTWSANLNLTAGHYIFFTPVGGYTGIKTGTVTIKITSATGKLVQIDGLVTIIRGSLTSTSSTIRATRLH